jgi:hypothetical protein
MLPPMIRRALTVLLAALATACASAAGFSEAPSVGQLVFVVAACLFAAGLQVVTGPIPGFKERN